MTAGAGAAWAAWLDSPPGRYLLAWEQRQFDELVDDVFGFYALQCGLSQLDCLRGSRMASHILARAGAELNPRAAGTPLLRDGLACVELGEFSHLPFGSQTVDLIVLPHVLEFALDPHAVLREVDRVLRPEGRLIVSGFNPVSLWGLRHALPQGLMPPMPPRRGQFIAPPRLRDWLKLLSLEPERARYGCYRPPFQTAGWLERSAFLEAAGDRWWPICGAVYALSAIKRVHAMRLVGKVRRLAAAPAPVAAAGARRVPAANEAIETQSTASCRRAP